MQKLTNRIKVTNNPLLYIGTDENNKWRIEKRDGRLDANILLSKNEAKEIAISMASIENRKHNINWRKYSETHTDMLKSYIMVQKECF